MKKYIIISQHLFEERDFTVEDLETGERFTVDFFSPGGLDLPNGVDATQEDWKAWLKTLVGKTLETEGISPYKYFTKGKVKITTNPTPEVYSE